MVRPRRAPAESVPASGVVAMASAKSPTDEVLVLEEFLPYRLSLLANVVARGFTRLYSERFGLSLPEWEVLAVLGRYGTLTSAEVCERADMHKTMVSRAVAELERHGLVTRRVNRADRREAMLSLTDPGRRMHGQILPLARSYAERLTSDLSEVDLATFDRVAATLRRRSDIVASTGG